MIDILLTQWRTALAMTASSLETSLAFQKSMVELASLRPGEHRPLDETRMRDAFHTAADQNLRRWESVNDTLHSMPKWYRDMASTPGTYLTDAFDRVRRTYGG